MTDRIATLTVVLDKEYRDDDVQHIVDAIQMTKGVARVELGPVADSNHYMSKVTILHAVHRKIAKLLDPKTFKIEDG